MFREAFKAVAVFTVFGLVLLPDGGARAQEGRPEPLFYCGITMVNPMTEIAKIFEVQGNVKIISSQGGICRDAFSSRPLGGRRKRMFPLILT